MQPPRQNTSLRFLIMEIILTVDLMDSKPVVQQSPTQMQQIANLDHNLQDLDKKQESAKVGPPDHTNSPGNDNLRIQNGNTLPLTSPSLI